MKFIEHLYVSNSIKNVNKVISKLKRNAGQVMVYITAISENPTEQLDIYHCSVLQQKYFHKSEDFTIVAITSSHQEAITYVRYLTEDCFKVQGDCNLKKYLLSDSFKGIISDRG